MIQKFCISHSKMPKIFIVDDEENIIELARLYLEKEHYLVKGVYDGKTALSEYANFAPDLIILDLMLPDMDGYEICRRIRSESNVPILMLTARKEDVDKIIGLEMGADDYLTKPFNPRELVARVKAILRRYQAQPEQTDIIEIGNAKIDTARHELTVNGKQIPLRTKEFTLLSTFARNPGIVFDREKLLETVWGFDFYGETRTVDVHINHLRDKLTDSGLVIETIRGVGYKLTERK